MPEIFISYRRKDTQGYAGRLRDSLTQVFPSETVFRDIDRMEIGLGFMEQIDRNLEICDVLWL